MFDQIKEKGVPIGDKWVTSSSRLEVHNPFTQTKIGEIPDLGKDKTEYAIQCASDAMNDWVALTGRKRARILQNVATKIGENLEELATIITLESGKPIGESRGEVRYSASFFEWFAEEAPRVLGDVLSPAISGRVSTVLKEPVGVCGFIAPWNFPSAMIARKVAPALAAGCAVVVKPSELTPFSAIAMADLMLRCGVPPGVVNIVTGSSAPIGETMCASSAIRKLSFTGSTKIGKLLYQQCAHTVKRLSLELGGNAPFIVFDDGDLRAAVQGVLAGKFRNCGQTCVSPNRFYVHEKVHDAFLQMLVAAIENFRVGDGLHEETDIGPLITTQAKERVLRLKEKTIQDGARVVFDWEELPGQLMGPTIFADVVDSMTVAQQEIFAPIVAVQTFKDEDDVVRRANDTPYGLAAYVYTANVGRAERVARALEYGMVGLNEGMISTAEAPFGGVKESGLGREGSHLGIDEFLESKYVCRNASAAT